MEEYLRVLLANKNHVVYMFSILFLKRIYYMHGKIPNGYTMHLKTGYSG